MVLAIFCGSRSGGGSGRSRGSGSGTGNSEVLVAQGVVLAIASNQCQHQY